MIASLHDKPSHEDEFTSKAVPATMYIGMLSLLTLMKFYDAFPSGGADTVSPHIFCGI